MDSNNVFVMFGTFKSLTKYGPLDPLFIAEVLYKIQEQIPNHFEHIIFAYINMLGIQKSENFGKPWGRGTNIGSDLCVGPIQFLVSIVLNKKRKNTMVES